MASMMNHTHMSILAAAKCTEVMVTFEALMPAHVTQYNIHDKQISREYDQAHMRPQLLRGRNKI